MNSQREKKMGKEKNSKFVVQDVLIDEITIDPTIQPRAQIREDAIFDYSCSISEGIQLPLIDVFADGNGIWLGDGYHRVEAFKLEGREKIPARVFKGGRREALLYASSANIEHGLRRTNMDKQRAVENVLKDSGLAVFSDCRIATICKVSQPYVSKVRNYLIRNGYKFPSVRVSASGRTIQTKNIGKKTTVKKTEDKAGVEEKPDLENPETNNSQDNGSQADVGQGIVPATSHPNDSSYDVQSQEEVVDPLRLKAKIAQLERALKEKDIELQIREEFIGKLKAVITKLREENKTLNTRFESMSVWEKKRLSETEAYSNA